MSLSAHTGLYFAMGVAPVSVSITCPSFSLSNDSMASLLPSGKSISEVGVKPDIEVNEEGDDFRIKTDTDNQLNYAIKLLNG